MEQKKNTVYISRSFEKGANRVMLAGKAWNAVFFFFRKKKAEYIFSLRNRWTGKDDKQRGKTDDILRDEGRG